MTELDKERQEKAITIISEIEEFLTESVRKDPLNNTDHYYTDSMDETDVLEFFADIISQLDTDIDERQNSIIKPKQK